ncbi:MAG: hypothetical protein RL305_205 [Pseudomonadota bacterium]
MFSSVKKIIQDAKRGKIFILVDDKNRENEGDLVIPASKIDHKKINFMATHGRGLICLAIDKNKAKALNLSLMPSRNSSRLRDYKLHSLFQLKQERELQLEFLQKTELILLKQQLKKMLQQKIYPLLVIFFH